MDVMLGMLTLLDLIFIVGNLNVSDAQRGVRCTEEQMDRARFVEENGTLENQMGAPRSHSLSLSLSLSLRLPSPLSVTRETRRSKERRRETIV